MRPTSIVAAATRRAWDEYMSVLVISAAWLMAQVLVIPGPPATAMLFAMARATHDGVFWSTADALAAFRALFWPAWRWGLPNLLVIGIGPVSYTHLRAHETVLDLVCRLLLEKKKKTTD